MNLVINLEDAYGDDDASLAEIIRDTIRTEIKKEIQGWVRAAVMAQQEELKRLVETSASRDWKKVAEALKAMQ